MNLPKELKIRIAQEKLIDLQVIAKFSESYFEGLANNVQHFPQRNSGKDDCKATQVKQAPSSTKSNEQNKKCFICGSPKHFAKDCKNRKIASAAVKMSDTSPIHSSKPTKLHGGNKLNEQKGGDKQ